MVLEMRIFQLENLLDCISVLFQMPGSVIFLSTQRQCGAMPSKSVIFSFLKFLYFITCAYCS